MERSSFLLFLRLVFGDFLPLSFDARPDRRHGSQHGALEAVKLSRLRFLSTIRAKGDTTAGAEVLRSAIWMVFTLH